jgi:Fe-S-cluster-containing dehydrogenase component
MMQSEASKCRKAKEAPDTSERSSTHSSPVTRRKFLLSSVWAGTSIFILNSTLPSLSAQAPRHSILVNMSECIGCMSCVTACKSYHEEYDNLHAEGTAYTKVAVVDNVGIVPELCLHCYDSPCTKACVTHALSQLDYGPVVFDREKCIGCLLCVSQCPFGSITFDPVEKKIYKCDMCHKAVEEGKKPYCVQVCPTGTRSFGLYEEKLAEAESLAEQEQGIVLYPKETSTLYVLTSKEFEKLVQTTDVTVIKREYPTTSKWVADLLKYSRLAWIPAAVGAAWYVLRWTKNESSGAK